MNSFRKSPRHLIQVSKPSVGRAEIDAVVRVLRSGRYASGSEVAAFEKEFARYVGTAHAVAMNSGTAALHLALLAHGIGPGDEVIVPPLTFFATIEAVLHAGARPVFADVDPVRYCLDPAAVETVLTSRTRAILPVHLHGQMADMPALATIAGSRRLILIEDCAQAHGSRIGKRRAGSWGHAAAFSFFATKAMTTGEGGMVTTNDASVAEACRLMRQHGLKGRDEHLRLGFNYKLTEFQAAMGRAQLKRLEQMNRARIRNSLYFHRKLEGVRGLGRPALISGVVHTFFWYPLRVDEEAIGIDTDALVGRLLDLGIEVRRRYREPLYRQKVLTDLDSSYGALRLPVAESLAGKLIGLPNHPGLSRRDLDRIIRAVKTAAAPRR